MSRRSVLIFGTIVASIILITGIAMGVKPDPTEITSYDAELQASPGNYCYVLVDIYVNTWKGWDTIQTISNWGGHVAWCEQQGKDTSCSQLFTIADGAPITLQEINLYKKTGKSYRLVDSIEPDDFLGICVSPAE